MTGNTCDLEEIKHQAKLKFLELMEKPEEWKPSKLYSMVGTAYSCSSFTLGRWYAEYPSSKYFISVHLKGEIIESFEESSVDSWPVQAWNKLAAHRTKVYEQERCRSLTKALYEIEHPPEQARAEEVVANCSKEMKSANSLWWVKYVLLGGAVVLVIQQVWSHI